MVLHFVVNDYAMRQHHEQVYDHRGRYVLAGATLAGALAGQFTAVHPHFILVLLALLFGGIILNVLKEELPSDRESHFLAFLTGTVLCATLILLGK